MVDLLFNKGVHTKNNRKYSAFIDLHFCENTDVRDWLLANGQDEDSVVLVESGVDTSRPTSSERPQTAPLRVGFSGRLSQEKAPLAFVELARRMADPRFRFVMTGAGPLESKVRRRVRRLPTGTVSFLGVVDDIDAHLASLDVLVVPSIMDGRPVVVLEALALGSRSSLPASADFPRWSVKGRPVSSSSQVTRMRSLGICGVSPRIRASSKTCGRRRGRSLSAILTRRR